jgi:hypothetical protein
MQSGTRVFACEITCFANAISLTLTHSPAGSCDCRKECECLVQDGVVYNTNDDEWAIAD